MTGVNHVTDQFVDSEIARMEFEFIEPGHVVILDAGGQYTPQILKQCLNLGVMAHVVPADTEYAKIKHAGAVIISGGGSSVYDEDAPKIDTAALHDQDMPVFGICYGMQFMAKELGGSVVKGETREDSITSIRLLGSSALFGDLENTDALSTHGDFVKEMPPGFKAIAETNSGLAAMQSEDGLKVAVQFHPEEGTPQGEVIFKNFLYSIAGLSRNEQVIKSNTPMNRLITASHNFMARYNGEDIIAFLSGGIDSTAMAEQLVHTIPDKTKLHFWLIDNGLMRSGEIEHVKKLLSAHGIDVRVFDAAEMFLEGLIEVDSENLRLSETIDPEKKRKICGEWFAKVAFEVIPLQEGLSPETTFLHQGTNETDGTESRKGIKTHHNLAKGLEVFRKAGRVVELLFDAALVKSEVRQVGQEMGLPPELFNRQPFPGPGLAIRIICEGTTFTKQLTYAEYTSTQHAVALDMYKSILPTRTVGLQGDARTYKPPMGLFCETDPKSIEDWLAVEVMARHLPQQDTSVNRGVLVLGGKAEKVEVVETYVNEETIEQIRQADDIVSAWQERHGYDSKKIAQFPVILSGLKFDGKGERSVVLRPFVTKDFKHGRAALPGKDIELEHMQELISELEELPWLSRVVYDLSGKPPGTTEWE